jgi:hypothetical protein
MLLSNLCSSPSGVSLLLNLHVPVIPFGSGYYATASRCATVVVPDPFPSGESFQAVAMPLLIDAFVDGASVSKSRKGSLHFLASVFANVSAAPAGRTRFMSPINADVVRQTGDLEYPLSKLVVFTEHPDLIRRGGIASLIK